jgi:hypothetical protein
MPEALEEADEVSEILVGEPDFEALGHEGKTTVAQGFDVAPGKLAVASVELSQGEMVGVFRNHPTVKRGPVGEGYGVACV